MVRGILGKKVGMTQIYSDAGEAVPVTVVQAGPCLVVQRKTAARDGYDAVQIGLVEERAPRKVTEPMRGHFKTADVAPMRRLAEFKVAADDEIKPGDQIKATIFYKPEFTAKSKLFVAVYLDGDTDRAQKYGDQFGVMGYPTMIVFDSGGAELAAELARIQQRCRKLVGLNPLLGREGYEPRTRGMLAAGKGLSAYGWMILAAVVLVAAIGVILLLGKDRRTGDSRPAGGTPPPPTAAGISPA